VYLSESARSKIAEKLLLIAKVFERFVKLKSRNSSKVCGELRSNLLKPLIAKTG